MTNVRKWQWRPSLTFLEAAVGFLMMLNLGVLVCLVLSVLLSELPWVEYVPR